MAIYFQQTVENPSTLAGKPTVPETLADTKLVRAPMVSTASSAPLWSVLC